ncbi:Uncharacterized protein APZ42_018057 [Daphnia magna]|uniref:Uncharacterized protein n=1 Tax=Daphnia magna TaxID=35525 RepID=A0A164ZHX5_9CRUS|nr:Uncharacterized protein APZ42_018057 [Daphnia magna]
MLVKVAYKKFNGATKIIRASSLESILSLKISLETTEKAKSRKPFDQCNLMVVSQGDGVVMEAMQL